MVSLEAFLGHQYLVEVLIEVTGSIPLPIQFFIFVGNVMDSKAYSLFKLNVSHLESPNLYGIVHCFWNLTPCSMGG
jgi:hypothetical protein